MNCSNAGIVLYPVGFACCSSSRSSYFSAWASSDFGGRVGHWHICLRRVLETYGIYSILDSTVILILVSYCHSLIGYFAIHWTLRSGWEPGFVCLLTFGVFFPHNFVDLLDVINCTCVFLVYLEWFASGVRCKQSNFFYNADMTCI